MVEVLEKIAGNYKTNSALRQELNLYKKVEIAKPLYNSATLVRSVEYDCDCGDSCDGDGGCDGGSCDGGD